MRIGAIQTGAHFFEGQLDEVKLSNYPLTELEVAASYNSITSESVCIMSAKPDSVYNIVDTGSSYCKVDLTDFAAFASHWLDCGLYPDCQ